MYFITLDLENEIIGKTPNKDDKPYSINVVLTFIVCCTYNNIYIVLLKEQSPVKDIVVIYSFICLGV